MRECPLAAPELYGRKTHRVAGSSSVGIRPASLDIHEAADAHAAIQHLETEPGVEGFEAGVTAEVNHVEGVEPSKEAAHEFRFRSPDADTPAAPPAAG